MTKLQKDTERKLDKLDTALLFISSSFGLGFTLMYYFFALKGVFYFLPILFIGWVMPIYVGYVRGALILDCLEERVRGWIYLISGIPFYFYFLIDRIIKDNFPTIITQDYFILASLITIFALLIVVFSLGHWIIGSIFRIFKRKNFKEMENIFPSLFFPVIFFVIFFTSLVLVEWTWDLAKILLFIIFFASILISEKKAQRQIEMILSKNN